MRRTLLITVVAILCLVVVGLWVAGDYLTKPARASTAVPDKDKNIESIQIHSPSGAKLSAWFLRGIDGAGTVLLLHSIRSNKRAMLARGRFLHALGFSVLMVDLQSHGESDGEAISFGKREAADVDASVEKIEELTPGERIGALGTSLGGASLLLSNSSPKLSAAVLEAVYPTIEQAVANRLKLHLGGLGPKLSPLLLLQLRPRLGVDPGELRPIDHVAKLGCPLMIVNGSEDQHTTIAEARAMFDHAQPPKEFYAVQGASHVDLHAFDRAEYERRIGQFLTKYLRDAG